MRYYLITDDAGFKFAIQTDRDDLTAKDIVNFVPTTRYAEEIDETAFRIATERMNRKAVRD